MLRRSFMMFANANRVAILYGSHTGTAEGYAHALGKYVHDYADVDATVSTMNDGAKLFSDPNDLPKSVVFVCATYGTGEFCPNAVEFWKKLAAGQLDTLKNVPYAIMGLGNTQREFFCGAAKLLNVRLEQLGGKKMVETELSCELQPSGHDTVFRSWKQEVRDALQREVAK